MNLKNKKRIILSTLALSIALANTGCTAEYQKSPLKEINELMEDDFYQESRALETNKEFYGKFYRTYLNNFVDYMSKKQYKEFKTIVTDHELLEECDEEKIVERLNRVLYEEDSRGIGVYAAFNSELLYEELNPVVVLDDEVFKHICNLKFLIDDDAAFFEAIFSKDINNLIDLICQKTGCEEDTASVLVTYFDEYYLGLKTGYFKESKEEIKGHIDYVIKEITKSKIENYKSFAQTFYGRMFTNNARYKEQVSIKPDLLKNNATILIEYEETGNIQFDFDSKYLHSEDLELWQLKVIRANDYIKEAYSGCYSEDYDLEGFALLSFLLSKECTLENTTSEDDVRCEIYNDLAYYFTSSEDFNDFTIKLFRRNKTALERYFEIFKQRIQEDGIDAYDFMRYESLRNLVKSNDIITIHLDTDNTIERREEIKNMPKDEALNYADVTVENYHFGTNYEEHFKEIDEILKNNDLGLTKIINDQVYFNWWDKPITVSGYSAYSTLVSKPVKPKSMVYNGIEMLYFEAPKTFENGYLAEVFYNIEGIPIIRKFEGLEATIKNPDTKEDMFIIAVSLNDNRKIPDELMFVKTYLNYDYLMQTNEDEKSLTR